MTRTTPNPARLHRLLRLLCTAALILASASAIARAMAATGSRGLAIAVIDKGRVVRTRSYGARNAAGAPLQTDTIMYGASLTKSAFAYVVMQLVDEGRLDLDTPLAH
jgi:CubicO group peptidase (beta-lactamase class C family)